MLCCAFTVGATSPMLLGYAKQHVDLGIGLAALAFVYLAGAVLILFATLRFFPADYRRANPGLSGPPPGT